MRRIAFALAAALAAAAPHSDAQDTRPGSQPASPSVETLTKGSLQDRTAVLSFLEDTRSADVQAWRQLIANADDPRFLARVIRGLGRVGEPELLPVLIEFLGRDDAPWTRDVQRGTALAVGLFGDPRVLPKLSSRATPRDVFFALGLIKKLAPDASAPIAEWTDAEPESRPGPEGPDTFSDPVVAALRWGASVPEPVFANLAKQTLVAKESGPARRLAAVDYFARSKSPAPSDVKPALVELLKAPDSELAGLAARALAKAEGAGETEVAAIDAAFVAGTDRVGQVDRIRALGGMKDPAAAEALVRAIGFARSDPAVLRTVLEALRPIAWDTVKPETRRVAAAVVNAIVMPGEGEAAVPADARAAGLIALAKIAPDRFVAALPAVRLAAPWPVRAALAEGLLALSPEAQDEHATSFYKLLRDPDRRVRIATWEAIADHAKEASGKTLVMGVTSAWVHQNAPGRSETDFALATSDPVELAVIAKMHAAFVHKTRIPPQLIAEAMDVIPHHEVEALQSVLDLAGILKSEEGNALLRRYLHSPEISLRKRAKDLLTKNGRGDIEALKEARLDAKSDLETGVARAKQLFDNPLPSAVIETNRGNITIQLFAADAPGTVANFLQLAKWGFYDGILWHRVVPAFVAQAGCPRGDGWGGPNRTIRCEVNDRTYRRGSVGMALAGKDTGGSQFFIAHRALPHLDGRYTLFGQVTEGMDVVDKLGQGDWIVRVREQ